MWALLIHTTTPTLIPAFTLGKAQPPVKAAPEDPIPLLVSLVICTHVHAPTQKFTDIHTETYHTHEENLSLIQSKQGREPQLLSTASTGWLQLAFFLIN